MTKLIYAFLAVLVPAQAAEIVLPASAFEREGTVTAIYRTGALATGKGELALRWTDSYGRVIADRKIPVEFDDENEIAFPLPVYRAVAMKNTLRAHLSFQGVNKKGEPDRREEDVEATFIAKPPDRHWSDYTIIMWQHHTPEQVAILKSVGINGGESVGRQKSIPEFLLNNNLRWYSENISTDFYSEYHRYFPDRKVNWKFTATRELYKKDRTSKEPLKRHPSLSDPLWLTKIHDRLVESAKFYSPYRPIFYSLGDESGIADLAAFWDFDFSDDSLAGMRHWLKQSYGTLRALNDQWGSHFTSWDSIIPDTTDEAMRRTDENYSSWGDFKTWMDIAYSSALKMGTDAVRSVDPDAYIGIGGGQMPGWGGYDYSRIAKSLNAIEPYDIGNNIEILRSLNPRMAVITTSFATGPWEQHRVWYEMLHGNRGLVIWDDKQAFIGKDNQLGARAHEVAPYYNELRNGLGAQLIQSRRLSGPIAIHYSQPSMRMEWMKAQKPKGENWVTRNSSTEYRDSEFLRLRESYCRLIEDEGLQYNFVSYGQVEEGELIRGGYKMLILPRSSALSVQEARAIREFASRGGLVIADGEPGLFDEHGRRTPAPQLAGLYTSFEALNYHQDRLTGKEGPTHAKMAELLKRAGVHPEILVTDMAGKPVTGIEVHEFRTGDATILALMTNPQLRVDELGPPEFRSNERFAKPFTLRVTFPYEVSVYDMRGAKSLGRKREMTATVQPYEPTIFTLSAVPLAPLEVSIPARVQRGEDVQVGLHSAGLVHLDVIDPSGKTVEYYSGNLTAGRTPSFALAMNDKPGRWQIRLHDLLSGETVTKAFEVY